MLTMSRKKPHPEEILSWAERRASQRKQAASQIVPTTALPGSTEKVDILRERVKACRAAEVSIFHVKDWTFGSVSEHLEQQEKALRALNGEGFHDADSEEDGEGN